MGQRRRLHFKDLDAVISEARRLAALSEGTLSQRADLAGGDAKVLHLGNMFLGQALGHLGWTLDLSSKPTEFRFPLPMRLMARLFKGGILSGRLVAPFEQPAELNRLITPDWRMLPEEGLAELESSVARFQHAGELEPNLLLGRLSRAEWVALTCRHAEWHLGFMLEP